MGKLFLILTATKDSLLRASVEKGCFTVEDRAECCRSSDGRPWKYHGEECVPAKPGKTFWNGAVCQPKCWVEGACLWGNESVPANVTDTCPDGKQLKPSGSSKNESDAAA